MDDASGTAELIRAGQLSPTEAVDDAIARIKKLDPELNAVIVERFERARAEAADPQLPDGPLRGVPYVLKDLDALMAGERHAGGIRGAKDAGFVPDQDALLVERLRAAGAVCVGKTNTPELGLIPTTEPAAWGPTRNPYDTTRTAGGSSGGSAAAVAAGMVPFGHGNDGGRSVCIPAARCGLVGLKPSRGRIPEWLEAPPSPTPRRSTSAASPPSRCRCMSPTTACPWAPSSWPATAPTASSCAWPTSFCKPLRTTRRHKCCCNRTYDAKL